jgi:hypothetical protein
MEIKNKQIFFIGIFILLVWIFFGVPTSWKIFLTVLSALYLMFLSVKISMPKRGGPKKPIRRKEKVTPVFTENSPMPNAAMPKLPDVENRPDVSEPKI